MQWDFKTGVHSMASVSSLLQLISNVFLDVTFRIRSSFDWEYFLVGLELCHFDLSAIETGLFTSLCGEGCESCHSILVNIAGVIFLYMLAC